MTAFTLFHVALSLIGIAAGLVVMWGFLSEAGEGLSVKTGVVS